MVCKHIVNIKPYASKDHHVLFKGNATDRILPPQHKGLQSSPWTMQFAVTLSMTVRTTRYNPIWKQKEEEGSLGNIENSANKSCYILPSCQLSLTSKPVEIFFSAAVWTHIRTWKHFPFNFPWPSYAGNFCMSIFYIYFYSFVVQNKLQKS